MRDALSLLLSHGGEGLPVHDTSGHTLGALTLSAIERLLDSERNGGAAPGGEDAAAADGGETRGHAQTAAQTLGPRP